MTSVDTRARLDLLGVTLADGRTVDVRVVAGRIDEVVPAGILKLGTSDTSLDLRGYLLLPAPAEPHAHLDKAYSADVAANPAGDLAGAVTAWLRHRPSMSDADITARAETAIRAYVDNGATAVRSHVDVGDDIGLRALTAVAAARDALAADCDVQLVAFVGNPLTGPAGAGHRALLADALRAGADVVGGCPGLDPEPETAIDTCLRIAGDHGAPVDLHIDEWLDREPCTLALLADAVVRTGFGHPVVASHCVSLGAMPRDQATGIADRVAAAGIAVICLPQTNLYLQARDHPVAPPRGLTAVRTLRDAGVTVAAGGDNLQDPFNCLGRADPLETAALLVLAGHDTPEAAYASVSTTARHALGLAGVDISPGGPAELVAIAAGSVRQAVAESTPERVVVHSGRVVARTSLTRMRVPSLPSRRSA